MIKKKTKLAYIILSLFALLAIVVGMIAPIFVKF